MMKIKEARGLNKLEPVNCAVCGSGKSSLLFINHDRLHGIEGEFNIVKCDECGLVFVNPRPRKEFINEWYPDAYEPYNINPDDFYQRLTDSLMSGYYKENGSLLDLLKKQACRLIYTPPPKSHMGRILDVGCGSGVYLHILKKHGWDVYGVEMSAKAVGFATEKMGLPNIRCGTLEEAKYPGEFFEVVLMSHVIEHLFDPVRTLHEINRILKKGGLLIITTPNIDSVNFKIFGKYWFPLETPRHLNLFEVSSMSKLFRETGFELVSRNYDMSTCHLVRSVGYLAKSFSVFANAVRFVFIPFAIIAAISGKSDIVTFCGKK
jgi:2-polyprenyl-3-methyl-5-hydroxy-6-metoxy-1,4-benzoquinol methylase